MNRDSSGAVTRAGRPAGSTRHPIIFLLFVSLSALWDPASIGDRRGREGTSFPLTLRRTVLLLKESYFRKRSDGTDATARLFSGLLRARGTFRKVTAEF